MALAQTALGEQERAEAALTLACEALDAAGYRSGRARAELVRAVIATRSGCPDAAERCARWAIGEFQQVEVYPTFILMAQALLEVIGKADDAVAAVADDARQSIHPIGTLRDLERRMWQRIAALAQRRPGDGYSLAASAPLALYVRARAGETPSAGFYNDNLRVDTPDGPVIVRIPLAGADEMDLRVWPEHRVLAAISPYVDQVPRVLHVEAAPPFQIHEYIRGELLDQLAPRGTAVPAFVPENVVRLFGQLATVPLAELPPPPDGWPADGNTAGFATLLSNVTASAWHRFRDEFRPIFAALGVPAEPLAPAVRGWAQLSARPFRLLHCDVHRKNIIVGAGAATFLDWELALWGDPVYDLAVHLHKMAYLDHERRAVVHGWRSALPDELTHSWETDIDIYLVHERIKSALVDTVRYAKIVAEHSATEERQRQLVTSLTGKLNAAGTIWGWHARLDTSTVAAVLGCS